MLNNAFLLDTKVSSANRRIAKNTVYMYARLLITMVIGLYSSRIVLQVLGVSDYGLFGVVGGILAMFTFISNSLGAATTRFLNTEMGKRNGDVNRCFNVNLLLHICLALIVLFLAETAGLWYVCNKLVVDAGKFWDAFFVYQVSIVIACLGIVNVPYGSLFGAHECFKFLSIFDIINTIIRFGCILLLLYYDGAYALRIYCLIMGLTTADSFVVFRLLASKKWPTIIKKRLVRSWRAYKDVLVFGNWNLLATMSFMARSSGTDLLINSFFGTAMNGAYAISKSVNNYVVQFSANFDGASGPQIIQSYAAGDKERYTYLTNKMGRFCLLLFLMVFFPLYIELEMVLRLWLGNVPQYALVFTQVNLILAGVSMAGGGIVQVINASGKIKWFKMEVSIFFFLCIPIGYFLLKMGMPAYGMLVLFLIADFLQRVVQLWLMKVILQYDVVSYIKEAYIRPIIISVIMTCLMLIYWSFGVEQTLIKVAAIVVSFAICVFLVFVVGMKKEERKKILKKLKGK